MNNWNGSTKVSFLNISNYTLNTDPTTFTPLTPCHFVIIHQNYLYLYSCLVSSYSSSIVKDDKQFKSQGNQHIPEDKFIISTCDTEGGTETLLLLRNTKPALNSIKEVTRSGWVKLLDQYLFCNSILMTSWQRKCFHITSTLYRECTGYQGQ